MSVERRQELQLVDHDDLHVLDLSKFTLKILQSSLTYDYTTEGSIVLKIILCIR